MVYVFVVLFVFAEASVAVIFSALSPTASPLTVAVKLSPVLFTNGIYLVPITPITDATPLSSVHFTVTVTDDALTLELSLSGVCKIIDGPTLSVIDGSYLTVTVNGAPV